MRERDFYPPGAYNDPNAPYNEVELPDIEVSCEVSITLTKKDAPVFTDNYIDESDDEGYKGYEVLDSYQELADKYDDQHYSLTGLLDELAKYIRGELQGDISLSRRNELERMLEDCQDWEEGDTDIEDYET